MHILSDLHLENGNFRLILSSLKKKLIDIYSTGNQTNKLSLWWGWTEQKAVEEGEQFQKGTTLSKCLPVSSQDTDRGRGRDTAGHLSQQTSGVSTRKHLSSVWLCSIMWGSVASDTTVWTCCSTCRCWKCRHQRESHRCCEQTFLQVGRCPCIVFISST